MVNPKGRRHQERLKRKVSAETPIMEFGEDKNVLRAIGPVIETYIGITDQHRELLEREGHAIPKPIRCKLLIDTGAGRTLVRHEIAEKAGLKLINSNNPIHGIGVDTTGKIYLGRVWFIVESRIDSRVTHNISVDTFIASGTLKEIKNIDGLIGRDVLSKFRFQYIGSTGKFTLQYLKRA